MITAALLLLIAVAKEQSENVQDQPPKPQILSNRRNKEYLSCESIILTCSITGPVHSNGTFHLYKNRQQVKEEQSQQGRATFTLWDGGDTSSDYNCVYTCTESGRRISSTESDTIKITVVDRPPKPQILIYPRNKVYLTGELVILTCWITYPVHSDGIFYLYKNRQPVKEEQSQQGKARFTLSNGVAAFSEYNCVYTCTASGRRITSTESDTMKITVVAQPPKPQISSDRGDKVYLTEESVILTCQITDPVHCDGTFHLYNNQQYVKKEPSQQGSATFTIATGGDASSQYSCIYWCTMSGRNISSRESDRIKLTVVEKSIQPWIPALSVVTLLLMLGVFGVYCWKKSCFTFNLVLTFGAMFVFF
ncbi:carcinoembryonic antigen-related cell adhesion molecule 5-like [Hypanus sabinus]|uniref:carcinoembryonic antigen-related cell adhesion molecule 5-like n=1 Tax=Hypanus sabinus TaxID=79690 RepID=UPI0028C40F2F|nr:carcinoembryonic antigen-related cell adhesion molecule 5-like [Hypanus sabinus]